MSEPTWRAELKRVLLTVTNIGQVHDYERWAGTIPAVATLFETTISGATVLRGWTISCQAMAANDLIEESVETPLVLRRYTYKIRGYFGLQDATATEKTALGIVLAVCDALDGSDALHGELDAWGTNPPAQVNVFEARMFGSILCHYAELTQEVTEMIVTP